MLAVLNQDPEQSAYNLKIRKVTTIAKDFSIHKCPFLNVASDTVKSSLVPHEDLWEQIYLLRLQKEFILTYSTVKTGLEFVYSGEQIAFMQLWDTMNYK